MGAPYTYDISRLRVNKTQVWSTSEMFYTGYKHKALHYAIYRNLQVLPS